jgi:hypothetical protein
MLHEQRIPRFHEKAPADSSVMNWVRRLRFGEDILEPGIHAGRPPDDLIDFKILMNLTTGPFHSMQTLATALKIPLFTIWDYVRKLSFVVKHLRWVPHPLDSVTRITRVTMAESLLTSLR